MNYKTTRYLAELLQDHKLTIAIHNLWNDLERILLATQRDVAVENKTAVCEAVDRVLTDLKMFADQGKLDLEYIKQIPSRP